MLAWMALPTTPPPKGGHTCPRSRAKDRRLTCPPFSTPHRARFLHGSIPHTRPLPSLHRIESTPRDEERGGSPARPLPPSFEGGGGFELSHELTNVGAFRHVACAAWRLRARLSSCSEAPARCKGGARTVHGRLDRTWTWRTRSGGPGRNDGEGTWHVGREGRRSRRCCSSLRRARGAERERWRSTKRSWTRCVRGIA